MFKFLLKISLILSLLIIFSCKNNQDIPPEETEDLTGDTSSTINNTPFLGGTEEVESLFETTENTTVFNVSDEKYWTSQGCTLWKVLQEVPSVKENDYSVIVQKLQGTPEAGYGIIFGHTTSSYGDCMLVFLINTEGQFTVGELIGTSYRSFTKWTFDECINLGYQVDNILKVSFKDYKYELSINDKIVHNIYVPSYKNYLSGLNGYLAVISPKDRLPEERVYIAYTLR